MAQRELVTTAIRPLRRSDRGPLLELLRDTRVFTDDELAIAMELIDTVLDRPEQKDYFIRVGEYAGRVAGYYCIGPTPGTEGTFDLYWIAVAPDLHGAGMGSALDDHAADTIRSRGGRLVVAETSSTGRYDATRAFYGHRGYREVARIPDYYRQGDDLVVFGKYLSHNNGG